MVRCLLSLGVLVLSWCYGWAVAAETVSADKGATEIAPTDVSPVSQKLYIIYDSSGSMWGELDDGSRKYEAGRAAMSSLLQGDLSGKQLAFRAYGHREKANCRDSELLIPFADGTAAAPQIGDAVGGVKPLGKTPISYSLKQALDDMGGEQAAEKGDILLISDGVETCDIDPCALMRDWRDQGINIRVFVVGVGLTTLEQQAMACIAETSGGQYFNADTAQDFSKALDQANAASEQPRGEPQPVEQRQGYALNIVAIDAQGRSFMAKGDLFKDGVDIGDITSNGRNVIDGAGEYEIEVGPVLADGSTYKPVRMPVSITEPGETTVTVTVTRPAIVNAAFRENGADHPGAFVRAYQDGEEVFGFRAFDEALMRPGVYEFRSAPNDDNALVLSAALEEGKLTTLAFELTRTIEVFVEFVLPNGETFGRGSELWVDEEKVYSVYGNGNPTTIKPGTYQLRSGDEVLPLAPVEVTFTEDGKTYQVPIDAGWITIAYAGNEKYYTSVPDRAFIESSASGKSQFARLETAIPVAPGRYVINPQKKRGFIDAVEVEVKSGETSDVRFEANPVGEITVVYSSSAHWTGTPDRAFVYAADGQPVLNSYMTPGEAKKFLPGRYRIVGGGAAGKQAAEQLVTLSADQSLTVELHHQADASEAE